MGASVVASSSSLVGLRLRACHPPPSTRTFPIRMSPSTHIRMQERRLYVYPDAAVEARVVQWQVERIRWLSCVLRAAEAAADVREAVPYANDLST